MRRLRLSDTETHQVVRTQTLLSERSTRLVGEGIGDWRPVAEGGSLLSLVFPPAWAARPRLLPEASLLRTFILCAYFWLCGVLVTAWAFLCCGWQGPLSSAGHRLLVAAAPLAAGHGL